MGMQILYGLVQSLEFVNDEYGYLNMPLKNANDVFILLYKFYWVYPVI